jgi:hypothetical protein
MFQDMKELSFWALGRLGFRHPENAEGWTDGGSKLQKPTQPNGHIYERLYSCIIRAPGRLDV